jgi:hypothetical protein
MLILPIVGGTLLSYVRVIAVPIRVTLVCVATFRQVTHGGVVGEWPQLLIGGTLAVAGILVSAWAQRESLWKGNGGASGDRGLDTAPALFGGRHLRDLIVIATVVARRTK